MDAKKKKKNLKRLGGRVTTVQEFLGLDDEDMAVIEARVATASGGSVLAPKGEAH